MSDLKTVREYVQPHRYHHYTAGVVIDLIMEVQAETLEWAAEKATQLKEGLDQESYDHNRAWNRLGLLSLTLRNRAKTVRESND